MSTITKQAVQAVADLKAGYTLGHADVAILNELARIALASLEAEADYIRFDCGCCGWETIEDWRENDVCPKCNHHPMGKTELFTAPPAPVSVPDDVMTAMQKVARIRLDLNDFNGDKRGILDCLSDAEEALIEVVNRRAAMLQGADGNFPVIPDWQAKAEKMAELHGSSFVVFRNGKSPQCADPKKVIISFTNEGLGHGSAAPQQEVK